MTSERVRTGAALALLVAFVGYVLLILYVATTGDPFAATVADAALAVAVCGYGLALFVRGPVADVTASVLFLAGFVRLLALVTGDAAYRLGGELLLALAVGFVVAGWLRRRSAAGSAIDAGGNRSSGRGGRAS
jgi:hypothetical protein